MLNDDKDKDVMRQQTVALVLMLLLFWGWYMYFVPKPQPPASTPGPAPSAGALAGQSAPGGALAQQAHGTDTAGTSWPFLPPVPTETNADDEIVVSDDDLELVFTRIGGRLKRASVLLGENGGSTIQLVPQASSNVPDTEAVYPLGLHFSDPELGDNLDSRRFEAQLTDAGRGVTFTLDLPGAARIRKSFRLNESNHVLDIELEYENGENAPRRLGIDQTPAFVLNWGPGLVVQHEGKQFPPNLIWRSEAETQSFKPADLPQRNGAPEDKRVPAVEWMGYKSKYFMAAFKLAGDGATADGWARGTAQSFRFGLAQPSLTLDPQESHTVAYRMYLGPMHLGTLSEAWPTLPTALRFFGPGGWFGETVSNLMDWFAKLLLRNLNWWRSFVPNYGIAIVLLTVLVRMVVFPLTIKSIRSMKKMQALQPELQAIKDKYKDEPQEFQKQMMLIYRERKINPLAGCFPIFLQMPVFIALYRMLWNAFELRGAKFLWIEDLSQPDALFALPFMRHMPFAGEYLQYFNVLPLLCCGAMILSMRLTPTSGPMQNPQQKMMMTIMPVFFAAISYPFSAGLNLYVFTSTLLGMLQTWVVRVTDIGGPAIPHAAPAPVEGPSTDGKHKKHEKVAAPVVRRKKPQHFYDRAQQRKRESARAEKRHRKRK